MNDSVKPDDIDPIIHERVRLAIVSALTVAPQLSFNELKATLGLSDGNLSAHSKSLEQAGYIKIEKTLKGRRSYTTMRLTHKGCASFGRYVETLRRIIDQGDNLTEK